MLASTGSSRFVRQQMALEGTSGDVLFGTDRVVTTQNLICDEIESRLNSGNVWQQSVWNILCVRLLCKR